MGKQFANDSMTPSPISVSKDKYGNEIAVDQPMHDNTTPAVGSFSWGEGHYADDCGNNGGYGGYGVSVADKGQSPSAERTSVDVSRADRGKES